MKNLLFAFIAISLFMASCAKQEELPSFTKKNETGSVDRIRILVGAYFTWDEWGRASRDCHGGGLCNFRLEGIWIEVGRCAPVQSDEDGNLFVDVLIDEDMPRDEGIAVLPVDKDITTTYEGQRYTVRAGEYPLNPELGTMGGYRVPLIQE